MRDCSWVPDAFPKLHLSIFICSSDRTNHLPNGGYNCIAWAAGTTDAWWWPADDSSAFWPAGLPREPINQETLANFVKAFEMLGFVPCSNPAFEPGMEKIAIFVGNLGTPTHAARSLPNGTWTSKLGSGEDIEHQNLDDIEGDAYGKPGAFLKRRLDGKPLPLKV